MSIFISKNDYESIQETIYINSIPGLTKAILKASDEPNDECVSHEEAWK